MENIIEQRKFLSVSLSEIKVVNKELILYEKKNQPFPGTYCRDNSNTGPNQKQRNQSHGKGNCKGSGNQ